MGPEVITWSLPLRDLVLSRELRSASSKGEKRDEDAAGKGGHVRE